MDLFEVLIILAFVGLPLLEGILKQRRKGRDAPDDDAPRRAPSPQARVPERAPRPMAEEGPAADMIPADLWEVLTGERRQTQTVPTSPPEEWVLAEESASSEGPLEEVETGWGSSRWEVQGWDTESLEEEGEEETLHDPGEVVSLEVLPPPPDVRHRLFHAKYDAPAVAPTAPTPSLPHGLRAALEGPGLQRAVLLSEILGPPKGLG